MPVRIRHSLQEIVQKYDSGEDRTSLENLVKAFRGIQNLGSSDQNSFFVIGGYHGEPFATNPDPKQPFWGGHCHHQTILFPTWHRAYMLCLEGALQSIEGCADVMLPYWDECLAVGSTDDPIPWVLTSPYFPPDSTQPNPLYSYKLQEKLVDTEEDPGDADRYTKPAGYETVRYPLSGLVGTPDDANATTIHNQAFADPKVNASYLNANVKQWLAGTVNITPDPADPTNKNVPDTYSVYSRFKKCLDAPNYTVFSNKASSGQWIKDHGHDVPHYVVSLEEPHNAIHLSLGGFYDAGQYNADPILGANGDIGENETAGFDPIFYLHHTFIDYVFWTWQVKNQATSHLDILDIPKYPGTLSGGLPGIPYDEPLDMTTPLYPFKKPDGSDYTSNDVTDIKNSLNYDYSPGSLTVLAQEPALTAPRDGTFKRLLQTPPISRADHKGSFVIRTYARTPSGKEIAIGRDAVLSRWNVKNCANCQKTLISQPFVPLDQTLLNILKEDKEEGDIKFPVRIQGRELPEKGDVPRDGQLKQAPDLEATYF